MSRGSCDYRQLQRLRNNLQKAGEDQLFYEACAKDLAARLITLATKRTPVGSVPKLDGPVTVKVKVRGSDGRKRNKSFLSSKGAILQKYWSGYQGGELRRSWGTGTVKKIGEKYQIGIVNPVEYASYVEYGHRQDPGRYIPALGKSTKKAWVPGKFMLTLSEKDIQRAAPGLLEKRLKTWLEGCMNGK